jgi:hypothetical protein
LIKDFRPCGSFKTRRARKFRIVVNHAKRMSYFQDIDRWLTELPASLPKDELDEVKRTIKEKLLESYRSGQAPANRENSRKFT